MIIYKTCISGARSGFEYFAVSVLPMKFVSNLFVLGIIYIKVLLVIFVVNDSIARLTDEAIFF